MNNATTFLPDVEECVMMLILYSDERWNNIS